MKCQSCGAEVEPNAVYCHKCGERVDATTVADDPPRREHGGADATRLETPRPAPESADDMEGDAKTKKRSLFGSRVPQPADEEETLWEGRYSAKAMVGTWIVNALISLVVLAVTLWVWMQHWGWLSTGILWGVVLGGLFLMWLYHVMIYSYRRISVRYRLTTHRFIHESGILNHVTDIIEVIDMSDIDFEQKIWERLTGTGTIRIRSSDQSHPVLDLLGLENARQAFNVIDKARKDERLRRGVHIEHI